MVHAKKSQLNAVAKGFAGARGRTDLTLHGYSSLLKCRQTSRIYTNLGLGDLTPESWLCALCKSSDRENCSQIITIEAFVRPRPRCFVSGVLQHHMLNQKVLKLRFQTAFPVRPAHFVTLQLLWPNLPVEDQEPDQINIGLRMLRESVQQRHGVQLILKLCLARL